MANKHSKISAVHTDYDRDFFITNKEIMDREIKEFLDSIVEDLDETRAIYEREFEKFRDADIGYFE